MWCIITPTKYPQSYKDKFLATTNFAKIDFAKRQNDVIVNGINYDNLILKDAPLLAAGANNGDVPRIFDYQQPNQIRINGGAADNADRRIVFLANGGTAIPNLATILKIGDTVYFPDAAAQQVRQIESFATTNTTNDTIVVNGANLQGVNAAGLNAQFRIRQKEIDTIASTARNTSEFELVFQLPMGIWHKDMWLPAHHMEIKLYPKPENVYQENAIQSINAAKTIANNDFNFEVQDMILYVAQLDTKAPDGQQSITYDDMRCQLTNITTPENVDNHFVVDRQSHSFTVTFQDESCETNSLRSCSLFKVRNEEDLKINRLWVDWNGKILPDPYPLIQKTNAKDFVTQRYYETMMYSESANLYDVESLDEFERAGAYYTFKFGKTDKTTEKVTVSTLFEPNAFGVGANFHNPNLLLFDHFTRTFSLKVSGGKVVEVVADSVN